MKTFVAAISYIMLFASVAFAENSSSESPEVEPPKVEQPAQTKKEFSYKSRPKLSYHSKKAGDPTGLERLKPMLEQMGGQGGAMPGSATVGF